MKTPFKARPSCVTISAIFLFTIAISLPVYMSGISMLDEGAMLYVAERLTRGDVLYRDIVTGIMPGSYYLLAIFLKIFGYSIITDRILASITLAIAAVLLYAISTRFIKNRTSLLITLLFISTGIPAYWMAGYSQFSITIALVSLLFFLRYLESLSPTALIISGATAGLALLFKQNYGVFITAGLGSILLARLAVKKEWRPVLIFSIAFLTPILLTVLYFYSQGALPKMVEYTIVSLFKKAANAYYKPYPLLARANPLFFTHELANFIPFRNLAQWALKENFAKEAWIAIIAGIIYLLPPLIIVLSIPYTTLTIIRKKTQWTEITLVLVSLLLFLGVFPRSDIPHLTFILPPILITGALLAKRLPLSGRPLIILRGTAFALIGLFSILCLTSSYMPFFHITPGKRSVALNMERAYGIRVEAKQAAVIRAVTRHIKENTAPDEPILVVPTGAMYYFLAERKSLVPYPLIMPGAMDEAEVIRAIEKAKLPYIVYSDMNFDGQTLSKHMPLIHEYITTHYHVDKSYPIRETGGATYVLRRGLVRDKINPLSDGVRTALAKDGSKRAVYYDFVKKLPEAKSGVVLGNGRAVPLFRANQVALHAWLLKDTILQKPGKRWSKVYTSFNVHIPTGSGLRFSIGQSPVFWRPESGDGALFEIYAYDIKAKRLEKIFSRYIDPKNNMDERRWFTYMAGLKKYWGRDLIISYVTSGGPRFNLTMGEINRWKHIDMAGWGGIKLVSLIKGPSVAVDSGVEIPKTAMPDEALAQMSRFDDISLFLEEEKKYPEDYDVRLALGNIYDRRGNIDKATEEFRRALSIYPSGSEARSRLARYDINAKRLSEAERLLAEGLNLTPGDARLNMTIAVIYRRRREFGKAVASYGRVLRARPNSEWARLGRARSYLATGKVRRARSDALKALRGHPSSSPALILLGDVYRFKKEWKRAESRYREALSIDPKSSSAIYKLGLTLEGEGRQDEALRAYRTLLSNKKAPESEVRLAKKAIASILNGAKERK